MSVFPATIDDNDAHLQYLGPWSFQTADGLWTGTYHETRTPGSQVFVEFTGSRVAIIVNIPSGVGDVLANVRLNNGAPVDVRHAAGLQVEYGKVLWDSGPIPFGNHTLALSNEGLSKYLRLDRFDYDPTDPAGHQPANAATVTTLAPTNMTTIFVTATQAPTSDAITAAQTNTRKVDSHRQSSSSNSTVSTREIVLISVLGALVLVFLGLLFCWLCHRRRNQRSKRSSSASSESLNKPSRFPNCEPFSVEPSVSADTLETLKYPSEKRGKYVVNASVVDPSPSPAASLRPSRGTGHMPQESTSSTDSQPS